MSELTDRIKKTEERFLAAQAEERRETEAALDEIKTKLEEALNSAGSLNAESTKAFDDLDKLIEEQIEAIHAAEAAAPPPSDPTA